MEDSLSIIFAIMLSLILMFIFPLIDSWNLQDNLSYCVAYAATVDFVDTARNVGYITEDIYDSFYSKLLATGNTYDISMEHRKYNEQVNVYLNMYTNEILQDMAKEETVTNPDGTTKTQVKGIHRLDFHDYFYVTVRNTNRTQATILSDFFTSSIGTNTKIVVVYGGIVWSARDEV